MYIIIDGWEKPGSGGLIEWSDTIIRTLSDT